MCARKSVRCRQSPGRNTPALRPVENSPLGNPVARGSHVGPSHQDNRHHFGMYLEVRVQWGGEDLPSSYCSTYKY